MPLADGQPRERRPVLLRRAARSRLREVLLLPVPPACVGARHPGRGLRDAVPAGGRMKPAGLFAPLGPWPFHGLEPHWANLIVVDPPWRFENYSAAGEKKGPQAQYPETYPPEEIASLFPVGELADINCLALVWATWPLIQRQMAVLHTWKL